MGFDENSNSEQELDPEQNVRKRNVQGGNEHRPGDNRKSMQEHLLDGLHTFPIFTSAVFITPLHISLSNILLWVQFLQKKGTKNRNLNTYLNLKNKCLALTGFYLFFSRRSHGV